MKKSELKELIKKSDITITDVVEAMGFKLVDQDCEDSWTKDSYKMDNLYICIECIYP